jgi:hypothetical protein
MKKRRTFDKIARRLRDINRDLAKGLTVSDVRRKINNAVKTYYHRREPFHPPQNKADRRCRLPLGRGFQFEASGASGKTPRA